MLNKNLNVSESIKRVIHHELGHWLMSRHLGFNVGEIKIGLTAIYDVYGHSTVFPYPKNKFSNLADVYDHMEKRVMILCAGVIADIIWHIEYASGSDDEGDMSYLYNNGVMDATGLTDEGKIEELVCVMNGIVNIPSQEPKGYKFQRKQILDVAWLKACEYLDDNPILLKMGAVLVEKYFKEKICIFDKEYLIKLEIECSQKNH